MVVFAMLLYEGAKFIQFQEATKVNKTVSVMTGMELM